jgi:hypothetical protein
MEFRVVFEAGTWIFQVSSSPEEDSYYEEFEITDLNEARDAVWDLVEEISRAEEDFDGDLLSELEPRDE